LPLNNRLCFYIQALLLSREFVFPILLNWWDQGSRITADMKAKQVFETYQKEHMRVDRPTYCPYCGSPCYQVLSGTFTRFRCSGCGSPIYRNPSPGVVALIVETQRLLLGKRAPDIFKGGKWSLPGGFIEFEEDFLSAAHREIEEETGLSVNVISILSVVSNFFSPELHTLVIVLLAEKVGGTLRPGDDLVALEWFPLAGPFPDFAFEADEHIIHRYHATQIPGAPVDPDLASR
jgi:8-oxo-dGTP diphosphatase